MKDFSDKWRVQPRMRHDRGRWGWNLVLARSPKVLLSAGRSTPPGLSLVALPAAAARPGPVEVAGRPIWMSDGVVLKDGALGDLPPWFVGWFLSEGRRS